MSGKTSAPVDGLAILGRFGRPAEQVAHWAAGTLVGVFCTAAAIVAWRSAAGALCEPLPPGVLIAVGGLTVVTAAGLRALWRQVARGENQGQLDWPVAVCITAAVLALGTALSLPRPAAIGWIPFWGLLIVAEVWAWRPGVWRRTGRARRMPPSESHRIDPPQIPAPHAPPAAPIVEAELPAVDAPPTVAPGQDVLQQLTRSCAADGSEQLAGWLRMPLAAGQRSGSVHLAFCPPFGRVPELSVEQLDGPGARIKTAQLLPHGARLDLKLTSPAADEPDSVLLQFTARSKQPG